MGIMLLNLFNKILNTHFTRIKQVFVFVSFALEIMQNSYKGLCMMFL
jgi:hypothetical protein